MLAIWLGLLLRLLVAIISDEGNFEYLYIGVPRPFDKIKTPPVYWIHGQPT